MTLAIRHMVCDRCLASVRELMASRGISVRKLELGRVETEQELSDDELREMEKELMRRGFELIRDRDSELVERIRLELRAYLRELERTDTPEKLSVFVARKLHYNYSYLSNIFTEQIGETVETCLIRLKIERVKELLDYGEMTLSQIAWQLNYSSVQYLSNQFKKVTGETVTEYLSRAESTRQGLDRASRPDVDQTRPKG
ncbi:MAG: helix-turn-helix domain-containing protein [Bacteroidota bacterium]